MSHWIGRFWTGMSQGGRIWIVVLGWLDSACRNGLGGARQGLGSDCRRGADCSGRECREGWGRHGTSPGNGLAWCVVKARAVVDWRVAREGMRRLGLSLGAGVFRLGMSQRWVWRGLSWFGVS